jgi:hypothetical protein
MPSEVFDFRWPVPETGFQWIDGFAGREDPTVRQGDYKPELVTTPPEWILSTGINFNTPIGAKQYNPLNKYPALFRTFAQLPLNDREKIRAFANEFGHLGIGCFCTVAQGPTMMETMNHPMKIVWGETYFDWIREVDTMKRAVTLWEMVQARDKRGLSQFIRWEDAEEFTVHDRIMKKEAGWYYDSHPERTPFPKDPFSVPPPGRFTLYIESVPELFNQTDVIMPALILVQRWINTHIKEQVSPRLLYHLDIGTQVLQILPHHLLSAMWLQFAQSIAGNKKQRACKECGNWFEISSEEDGRTKRRMFCSDPCKSRDYRRRKEKAQQMKAEGRPVKEIAKELDTDITTIKNWVSKRKG